MSFKFTADEDAGYIIQNGYIIGHIKYGNPQLSPHFKAGEFACKCCGRYKIAIAVLEALENVRDKAGRIQINSGYRCEKHNEEVGGVKNSQHMQGKAVDMKPLDISVAELLRIVKNQNTFANGGIGLYSTFVHADCSRKRRWKG